MADRKETQVPGLIGLIKCQPRTASAASMIPIYEELLAASPDFSEASGDVTYLKLLVGEDIPESAATAEKLLAAEPNSLPRISTAALGRLRLGDARGALALYEGKVVDWTVAPEPWKVVHIAVLRANGDTDGAAMQSATLIPSVLRQEERELLNPPGTKNPAQKIKK